MHQHSFILYHNNNVCKTEFVKYHQLSFPLFLNRMHTNWGNRDNYYSHSPPSQYLFTILSFSLAMHSFSFHFKVKPRGIHHKINSLNLCSLPTSYISEYIFLFYKKNLVRTLIHIYFFQCDDVIICVITIAYICRFAGCIETMCINHFFVNLEKIVEKQLT